MKRNSVTISKKLYDIIKDIRPKSVQFEVLFLVLDSLFDGKMPDTTNCSNEIHNAFVGLHYELSLIQKQFDNGKSAKKLREQTKGALCLFYGSEEMPIQTMPGQNFSPDYYINNYNINNNNYNNQSIISNNKNDDAKTAFVSKINQINEKDHNTCKKFLRNVKTIKKSIEPFPVYGKLIKPGSILELLKIAIYSTPLEELLEELQKLYIRVSEQKVSNEQRYEIAGLYLLAKKLAYNRIKETPSKNKTNLNQRTYTQEQISEWTNEIIESCWDNDI